LIALLRTNGSPHRVQFLRTTRRQKLCSLPDTKKPRPRRMLRKPFTYGSFDTEARFPQWSHCVANGFENGPWNGKTFPPVRAP
jgi:hypothetical protein